MQRPRTEDRERERERERVVCCCSATQTCFGSEGAKQNGDGGKRKQAEQAPESPIFFLAILAIYSQNTILKMKKN